MNGGEKESEIKRTKCPTVGEIRATDQVLAYMVTILDGNLEIGAHVRSHLCYLICLRHLLGSTAVTNSPKKNLFPYMRAHHGLIYHLI